VTQHKDQPATAKLVAQRRRRDALRSGGARDDRDRGRNGEEPESPAVRTDIVLGLELSREPTGGGRLSCRISDAVDEGFLNVAHRLDHRRSLHPRPHLVERHIDRVALEPPDVSEWIADAADSIAPEELDGQRPIPAFSGRGGSSPATSNEWAIEAGFRDAKRQLGGGEARNRTRAPPTAAPDYEPRTDRWASVRVLVLPPGPGLGGLGFRRSLEQEAVVRRDKRVGRHHRVGVIDGPVLAREGNPARALAQLPTLLFTAGYLAVWTGSGLLAYGVFSLVTSFDTRWLAWDRGGL